MKFDEAIKELLNGNTIWRMNYDHGYDEVLRDEISFDGKHIHLRKSRVILTPNFTRREKVLRDSDCQGGLTFFSEELAATDWNVKDDTCSAEEALRAFREGKWIRHKTSAVFVKKDPDDPKRCVFYRKDALPLSKKIRRGDMEWSVVEDLFVFSDGWIVSDKETPEDNVVFEWKESVQ